MTESSLFAPMLLMDAIMIFFMYLLLRERKPKDKTSPNFSIPISSPPTQNTDRNNRGCGCLSICIMLAITTVFVLVVGISAAPKEDKQGNNSFDTSTVNKQSDENYTSDEQQSSTNNDSTSTNPTYNEAEQSETIVYITDYGEKYHESYCRTLKDSHIAISLEDAKSRGFEPCGICKPPT